VQLASDGEARMSELKMEEMFLGVKTSLYCGPKAFLGSLRLICVMQWRISYSPAVR